MLDQIPVPEPGPGQIRLRVTAVGISFVDLLLARGGYQVRPEPPFVSGTEFCGVVDAIGPATDAPLQIGDLVYGTRQGAWAEYMVNGAISTAAAVGDAPPARRCARSGSRHAGLGWSPLDGRLCGRPDPEPEANLAIVKGASLIGVDIRQAAERDPAHAAALRRELLTLYGQSRIQPLVHSVWPLERFAEAAARAQARDTLGRVVVTL